MSCSTFREFDCSHVNSGCQHISCQNALEFINISVPLQRIQAIDLFSGCGGLSFLAQEGTGVKIESKHAVDLDHDSLASFKVNHPDAHVRLSSQEQCPYVSTFVLHLLALTQTLNTKIVSNFLVMISRDIHLIFSLQTHQMGVEEFLFLCKKTNNLYHSYSPPTKKSRTAVRCLFTFLFYLFLSFCTNFSSQSAGPDKSFFVFWVNVEFQPQQILFFVRCNTHLRRCRVVLLSHKLNNWAFPHVHILKNDWTCRLEKTLTAFFRESAMSMACIH